MRPLIRRTHTGVVLTLLALGCSDGQGPSVDQPLPPTPFVVSSPVAVPTSASPGVARSGPGGATVVYVSLPPGAIPDGHTASIRDIRIGSGFTAVLVDGGFDPVALSAAEGDTLLVVVQTGSDSVSYRCIVAGHERPIVVRTSPPPHKRDVPLNAVIVVVFSEPMDSSTLAGAVGIHLGGLAVPGTVTLASGQGDDLRAEFVPASQMAPSTIYKFDVSTAARSASGEPLASSLEMTFTTGSAIADVAAVRVIPSPLQVVVGRRQLMSATPLDSTGSPLAVACTWSTNAASIATVSSAGQVSAVTPGTALIRASCGGVIAEAIVTVVPIPAGLTFTSVSAGGESTCGLTLSGKVYCWGFNVYGQLGYGAADGPQMCPYDSVLYECSPEPVAVASAGHIFTAIGANGVSNCGLTSDGIYCWGYNEYGLLGNRTPPGENSPVPTLATPGSFVQVSVGFTHVCGVTREGTAYCWGGNGFGELGTGVTGVGNQTQPQPVIGGLKFAMVTAGSYHTCGLTFGGIAYCWGDNRDKVLGHGNSLGPQDCIAQEPGDTTWTCSPMPVTVAGGLTFTSLSAGHGYTCGVITTGAAYCWGGNSAGNLGNGSMAGPEQCATRYYQEASCSPIPLAVTGGLTFKSISAGYSRTCGLTTTGQAYCWGSNGHGGLGDGSTVGPDQCGIIYDNADGCSPTPVAVAGGLTFASVSPGCGVTTGGTAYCWGDNRLGQLGDGTTNSSTVPVKVAGQP